MAKTTHRNIRPTLLAKDLPVYIGHVELAALLGCSRPTASRRLATMRDMGLTGPVHGRYETAKLLKLLGKITVRPPGRPRKARKAKKAR